VPPFWESGHRLHLAAACVDLERWGDVVEHLAAARELAPQWSRVQPLGHTVLGQLVEHRGRRSERIMKLAAHYGAWLASADQRDVRAAGCFAPERRDVPPGRPRWLHLTGW
jgi:hypothetical protein